MLKLNINRLKRKSKIGNVLYNHIINNKRGYFIISILFFIGLILGVLVVYNINDTKIEEINNYFYNIVKNIKSYQNIDFESLFKQSVISNFIMVIVLWFGASTIIGILILYGTIIFRGFSIGYTISCIIAYWGIGKGTLIALSINLLHNIAFIPAMFGISVSGVKLYQSIMKNRDTDNIKLEMLRHTIFSVFMLGLMLISSIIEVYGSTNIFIMLLKKI